MLTVENITYSYSKRKKPVLENYSLSVGPGIVCGLLGENGAGKSTLLYLISGLLKPLSGSISYNGFRPWNRNVDFLNDIFLVPEEIYLPNVRLEEFVKTSAPFYPKFSMEDLRAHLKTFELSPDVHLGQLSMGQKKRVFISFALACNTSLLLLDEPTNGLDIPGKRLFKKAVVNGMTDEKTIIISTHQVYDIEQLIDHVIITDKNGVLLDTSISKVMSKLSFTFTPDRSKAMDALFAIDVPGGSNIVKRLKDDTDETDVNLETLFELTRNNPAIVSEIFNK